MPEGSAATHALRRVGWLSLAAAAILAVILLTAGWLQGWRWFDVTTPSMGTAAPVGSLVVTRPTQLAEVEVGDVIVFTNPRGKTYSHRVVEVGPAGVKTRGDINGATDPWLTTQSNLVGEAAAILVNGGFVLRGIPWLIGGICLVQLLVIVVRPRWRSYARFLLTILVIDAVLIIVHPLVGLQAISYGAAQGGVRATVVSTGILPVAVTGVGGDRLEVDQGEVGSVISQTVDGRGTFTGSLNLNGWWWLLAIVLILLPLAWSLLVGFRVPVHDDEDDEDGPADAATAGAAGGAAAAVVAQSADETSLDELLDQEPTPRVRRWFARPGLVSGSALSLALVVLLGLAQPPAAAMGAFSAEVANSDTEAGTRQFFTCLDAIRAYNDHPKGVLWVGYALGGGSGVAAATDQSGKGYNVTASGISGSALRGCLSDAVVRGQNSWALTGTKRSGIRGNTSSVIAPSAGAANDSNAMTWTLWFRTTSTTGGVLTCSATAALACTDRTTWLTNSGRLAFQVGTMQLLTTQSWNDGSWHFLVAQLSRTSGMKLWVDGTLRASNGGTTAGTALTQQPQWGYSNAVIPFANAPTTVRFAGNVQMGAMIAETAAGGRIGDDEVLELYQSANV